MVRTIAIGVLALVVAPVWGDEATDRAVAEALTVLADAQAKPPTSKERIAAARQAIKTLQKHRRGGLASAAWNIAADARQSDELRSVALVGLSQLPDSPTGRVRTLAADTVKSDKASKLFRARAAMVLRNPRFADAASRAALEQVLLRKDDPVVQRTCLAAYGATAE
ncbi:MAG: hypothetical protein OER88_09095, partial [Planctomycetota bacterium]|nr:hypothetical protein [Planctomycetota bacterium]